MDTVSAEIKFIANYMDDLVGKSPSADERKRLRDLLAQAQIDFASAVAATLTRLGQNPFIGE